jgi:hypothetical protein
MENEVTQEQTANAANEVMGEGLTREEMQNEFYIRDLIKTYLDRIDGQRDRDKFITFARGIIQEMQIASGNNTLGRSGEYSYRAAFDLAWEGLYGEEESSEQKTEPSETQPEEKEPVKQAEPTGTPPTPTKRVPGDIQPMQDGEEMESYTEKLGLSNYAKARNKLHKMTKTLKTTHASEKGLNEIMKDLDAD